MSDPFLFTLNMEYVPKLVSRMIKAGEQMTDYTRLLAIHNTWKSCVNSFA